MRSLDQIEDDEALLAAKEIKRLAQLEVDLYIKSDEFKAMIEKMKQRERQRMLNDIENDLRNEKISILAEEKKRLQEELDKLKSAEEIKLMNQWLLEEQQRKANSLRLLEIQQRQSEQEATEREMRLKEEEGKVQVTLGRIDGKKLSFGLKKKSVL
jgi:deoxyribodipyrimidine photolyase